MNFKGINVETKLRLKAMALLRGIPLYQLLDEMVERAWEEEQDTPAAKAISHKLRKEIRKTLKTWMQ